jgi:hypothetical protein
VRIHVIVALLVFLLGSLYAMAATRALSLHPEYPAGPSLSGRHSHSYLVGTATVSYACILVSFFIYRRRAWACRVAAILLALLAVMLLGLAPWMLYGDALIDRVTGAGDRVLGLFCFACLLLHPSLVRAVASDVT